MKKTLFVIASILMLTLCLALCSCGGEDGTDGGEGGNGGGGSALEFSTSGDDCYVSGIGDFKGSELVIPSESPDGKKVVGISRDAFTGCTSLVSVTIPATVTSISYDGIFVGCTSLKTINVDSANKEFCSVDGVLFDKQKETIIRYPSAKNAEKYDIPSGTTDVRKYAFEGCASLTKVTLPDGISTVGDYAFEKCTSLKSMHFPDSVSGVGKFAFDGCTSLESFSVGKSNLRYSGRDGVLYNKKAGAIFRCPLTKSGSFSLPSTVNNITTGAFKGCDKITDVTIPADVTNISDHAFYGCKGITKITFRGTKAQWNAIIKGADWDYGMSGYTVKCSDGDITK